MEITQTYSTWAEKKIAEAKELRKTNLACYGKPWHRHIDHWFPLPNDR